MDSIFITVRTDSTRLPQKAFKKFGELTAIEFLIDRLKNSKKADSIVLCTTDRPIDNQLAEIAKKSDVLLFRGSTEDKLQRWSDACDYYNVDFFVTADGDDLFCSPLLIDQAFEQHKKNPELEFIKADGVICGAFTYGISCNALKKACQIKGTTNTEMMWVYFTETGLFVVDQLKNVNKKFFRDDVRMTLDYQDDLKFFLEVFEQLGGGKKFFDLHEIVDLIDKKPEIAKINIYLQDAWKKNQEKNIKLVLK